MKKVCIAVAALCLATVSTWGAMGDVGIRGGYMRMADADEGAALGGLFFRTDWRSIIFIDGSLYYHSEEVTDTVDVELIPFQLSAMAFLLGRDGALSPFVLGGAGIYWTRTTQEGQDAESEFDFGWHLGLGADFNLSDRMFVEGDFRYIWLDVDNKGKTFGESLSNFNHWIAGVGLGFRL